MSTMFLEYWGHSLDWVYGLYKDTFKKLMYVKRGSIKFLLLSYDASLQLWAYSIVLLRIF